MFRFLAAAIALYALPAFAQQEGMLHPVPLAEARSLRARLNLTLLPANVSHLEVEPKQVFRLVASGQPDLLLVPVIFEHGEVSEMFPGSLVYRSRCGLYVLPADTPPQTFIYTITGEEDLAVSQCGNLIAVRRTQHDGPHPHLRLTYRTFDPPRFEDTADIQLAWNPKTATYGRAAVIPGK